MITKKIYFLYLTYLSIYFSQKMQIINPFKGGRHLSEENYQNLLYFTVDAKNIPQKNKTI